MLDRTGDHIDLLAGVVVLVVVTKVVVMDDMEPLICVEPTKMRKHSIVIALVASIVKRLRLI